MGAALEATDCCRRGAHPAESPQQHKRPHAITGAAVACVALLACAGPIRHAPEPYASDPNAARALEARASEYCAALHPSEDQRPTKSFVTDGCSGWLDREWDLECCVSHDIAYWCGGTREQRRQADAQLGECVAANTARAVGTGMRLGVRIGGHPLFPTSYRWGYGHSYRACYPSAEAQRPPGHGAAEDPARPARSETVPQP